MLIQKELWLGIVDLILLVGYIVFAIFVTNRGDFYQTRRWKGALLVSAIFCFFSLPIIVFFAVVTLTVFPLEENASLIDNLSVILMLSLAFFVSYSLLMTLAAHNRVGPKEAFLNKLWKDPNQTEVIQTTKADAGYTQAESQQRLMVLFNFDIEDLQSNREGKLSDRQKARFFRDAAFAFFAVFFGGLAVPIILWIFPYYEIPFIFTALCPIVLTPIGILAYWLNMRPAREGVIKHATGPLSISLVFTGGNTRAISIGGEAFAVNREIIRRLELDAPHRIYFTPAYKNILSIERLDSLQN